VGSFTLTNSTTHTINGFGRVGQNDISIFNSGLIDANVTAQGIVLDPHPAAGLVNAGTLQASNSGVLGFTGSGGGSFNNSTGFIHAADTSEVQIFSGAEIVGGTFSTAGSGVIRVLTSQNVSIANITNLG